MPGWLSLLLFSSIAWWLTVSLAMALAIHRLSRPERLLLGNDEGDCHPWLQAWARSHGFQRADCFRFAGVPGSREPVTVALWRAPDTQCFLVGYAFRDSCRYEFITFLDQGGLLTTSAARESLNLPLPPGQFVQVFEGLAPEDLLAQHRLGLAFLERHLMRRPVEEVHDPQAQLLDAMRRQMEHVLSMPLWYLRSPWWGLTRPRRINRPLVEPPSATAGTLQ